MFVIEIEIMWVFYCDNCGVDVEFDEVIYVIECLFCVLFVVIDMGEYWYIKFKVLLFFVIDENVVCDVMNKWMKGFWFVLNGLYEYVCKGCKMNGIYVFYWIYDVDICIWYSGECGDYYYEIWIVVWDGKIEIE